MLQQQKFAANAQMGWQIILGREPWVDGFISIIAWQRTTCVTRQAGKPLSRNHNESLHWEMIYKGILSTVQAYGENVQGSFYFSLY